MPDKDVFLKMLQKPASDDCTIFTLSDTMEALISNIYAAYQFCDDMTAADQLHNLWNDLIVNGEMYVGKEEGLIEQLNTICETIRLNEA